jgi:hypothetical protein
MWELQQLLTSQHNSPLAAVSMALPCPPAAGDPHQLAEGRDERMDHTHHGHLGRHPSAPRPFTASHTASLAPGIAPAHLDAGRFAESIVLRGARGGRVGALLDLHDAAAALDASLQHEEHARCVQQRTLSSQPLPIPLPFPAIFSSRVSAEGNVPWGAGTHGAEAEAVASCPVLTRLCGTGAFAPLVGRVLSGFRGAAASTQGRSLLRAWGRAEQEGEADIVEGLLDLEKAYEPPSP